MRRSWRPGPAIRDTATGAARWCASSRLLALKFFALASGLILLTGCASTGWRPRDTALEASWQAVNLVDGVSTSRIRGRADLREGNPIPILFLGEQPGNTQTAAYFIGYGFLHYAISRMIPPRARAVWQSITLYDSATAVAGNCEDGLC